MFSLLLLLLWNIACSAVTNFTFGDGDLILWLYSTNIVRISHLPSVVYEKPSLYSSRMVSYIPDNIKYEISQNANIITITTDDISIHINNSTKIVSFFDLNSNEILSETSSIFMDDVDRVLNKPMYDIQQEWSFTNNNTAIYGFGSYQNGFINYRDQTIRCVQFNTEVCIPFMITNNGYGILWDNNGATTLNNKTVEIINWNVKKDETWYNMTTTFKTNDGYYSFFIDFNNIFDFGDYSKSSDHYLWIFSYSFDGINFIEYDSFGIGYVEMPSSFAIKKLKFSKSSTIILSFSVNNTYKLPQIYYRYESIHFDIQSLLSNYIDYYYIFDNNINSNSNIDNIISGYRLLTGGSPQLYSINVYGFWHSENAFGSQQAVLNCANQYRSKQYPVDNIVQDYYYWGKANDWGPQWDTNKYPNPKQMLIDLHSMNFKFMISVWPQYGTNTTFYKHCLTNNYLINPTEWLDIYQNNASYLYYYYINQSMFSINVDYIWADSTEPDNFPNRNKKLLSNIPNNPLNNTLITESGNVLINPYSLYVIKSLYDGYTKDYPLKRIFSLTRSGFGGQEKYGSTIWTGDISNEWDVLRRQIAASINYPFTGNNYWSNDIGGFYRYCNGSNGEMTNSNCYTNIYYHRLMIRWFQFGVFVPIYRVHGYGSTAPYNFGDIAGNYTLIATNLRYRLLPYIYTCAYMVRYQNYSMQRGLIFDFPNDLNPNILNIYNEFMFGPFLLVAPVFNDDNMTNVYLPTNNSSNKDIWYNFWTGDQFDAAQEMHINVPLSQIAIYVKSGSILIMGPFVQYSNEKLWDKLEVRVYKGNDGSFNFFEDDFFTRNSVENNEYSMIPFDWNGLSKELTIGNRIGSFKGMINQRTFDITLVTVGNGIGVNVTTNITKSVVYSGKSIVVSL